MLTLSDIRSRVRTRFEASSTTRWSNSDVNDAINDGLEELAEATGYYERYVSVPLKEARVYYDLRGLTPATVLSVTGVWHQSGNRWLAPAAHTDIKFSEWEDTAGDPILWFTRGQWWLGIFPRPSSEPDEWLRVYFTAVPARMTEDGEGVDQLPEEFVPAVEEYALYELYQREGEVQKCLYWWEQYKVRESALEKHMRHRVSRARIGMIGSAQ